MMDFTRQRRLLNEGRAARFHTVIVGAGGIGSFLTLALAKMGLERITVCDFDTVAAHNLPNQLYGQGHVGLSKVDALREVVFEQTGTVIGVSREKLVDPSDQPAVLGVEPHSLLIAAVDNMESRVELFQNRRPDAWFIDGRMAAQMMWVLTCRPGNDDVEFYNSHLYSDEEASEEPCTARATVFGGLGIASVIAAVVRRIIMGDDPPREVIYDYVTWSLLATQPPRGGDS